MLTAAIGRVIGVLPDARCFNSHEHATREQTALRSGIRQTSVSWAIRRILVWKKLFGRMATIGNMTRGRMGTAIDPPRVDTSSMVEHGGNYGKAQ